MSTASFIADEVYSFAELCLLLKKAKSSMYALVSDGRAPKGFHVGRDLRFRRSVVFAWMAEQEQYEAELNSSGRDGGAR
jgi:predicted DNA-binding transcriptional regulator AlpA